MLSSLPSPAGPMENSIRREPCPWIRGAERRTKASSESMELPGQRFAGRGGGSTRQNLERIGHRPMARPHESSRSAGIRYQFKADTGAAMLAGGKLFVFLQAYLVRLPVFYVDRFIDSGLRDFLSGLVRCLGSS